MNNKTYNGWTNYATWRVKLEIFDGMDITDITTVKDPYDAAESLKDYLETLLFPSGEYSLVDSYAESFLSDVNYVEIAQSLLDDYEWRQNNL